MRPARLRWIIVSKLLIQIQVVVNQSQEKRLVQIWLFFYRSPKEGENGKGFL